MTPVRRYETAPGVPAAVGPYVQATSAGGFVFTTGQIPAVPGQETGTFEDEVRATLTHLASVLAEAGSGLDRIVKLNAFLSSPEQLAVYNQVYETFFADLRPARTTVCVGLWGVSLEIDCIAVAGPGSDA
ncbi:RidA family protein [Streptomyces scopuliridis]|uniref:Translation initiation inhibitor n=1 Tax=Streptomyces scopuliridis RB72 TaxID=1440053 RepID=A0A2T7T9G1_9ACTN|nr:Rid family hydrolase [Streptomyces scopuliridis]PVE11777.1 translation initiation inhibitor [Streptomyces scopuliridis RB72]